MKKVLVVIAVLVLLLVIGIAVFLATFDADRYRPLLISRLEQAIGRPVQVGRLRAAWHGGIALELQGVTVGEECEAEAVHVLVALPPLLKQQVEIESVHVTNGTVRWTDLSARELSLSAALKQDRLQVKSFRFILADGTVRGVATVEQLRTIPKVTAECTVEGVSLSALKPPRTPTEPHLEGRLSGSMTVMAEGKEPAAFQQSLAGEGTCSLAQWKLVNLNVLREVFAQLSMLPGVMERLQSRLPPSYAEKLSANDTVFEPVTLPFVLERGVIRTDHLHLVSDSFAVEGAGQADAGGAVSAQVTLSIDPELSEAFARSVEELRGLMDAQGRLVVPVSVRGTAPEIAVMPDLQYVASKLLVTKAQEWLGDFLQRALENSE